ncbi:ABC transporter substrate-binding protein [Flavobacteriaceae bacterium]|nr:ABC transporter substrate-binding protein [Flavobacteriaceae bacterium]
MKLLFLLKHLMIVLVLFGCTNKIKEINIGCIAPLTSKATKLGNESVNTIRLTVDNYNRTKKDSEPIINLHIEDGKWNIDSIQAAYKKLRTNHDIKVLLSANYLSLIKLKKYIIKDDILAINYAHNSEKLASLDRNIFRIAMTLENSNAIIAKRIFDKKLNNIAIINSKTEFSYLGANAIKNSLNEYGITNYTYNINYKQDKEFDQLYLNDILSELKQNKVEACVFVGYSSLHDIMLSINEKLPNTPFFLGIISRDSFLNNHQILYDKNIEFPFLTELDGNYIIAKEFINNYINTYNVEPEFKWICLQAYDTTKILINELRSINENSIPNDITTWLRHRLFEVNNYKGASGNLSIKEDGSVSGINFSIYQFLTSREIKRIKSY